MLSATCGIPGRTASHELKPRRTRRLEIFSQILDAGTSPSIQLRLPTATLVLGREFRQ
jgi:hypothetical protein